MQHLLVEKQVAKIDLCIPCFAYQIHKTEAAYFLTLTANEFKRLENNFSCIYDIESTSFILKFENLPINNFNFKIYDLLGRIIYENNFLTTNNFQPIKFEKKLELGSYISVIEDLSLRKRSISKIKFK